MSSSYETIDGSGLHPRKTVLRVLAGLCVLGLVIGVWALAVPSSNTTPAAEAAESPSLACPLVHQSTMQKYAVAGGREVMLYVPSVIKYPAAVIFAWHGLSENPTKMEDRTKLMAMAETNGFLVVYPQAKNPGVTAAFNGAACCKNDPTFLDVQFAQDTLNALSSSGCVDLARAFSLGFSNGAFMTHRLACEQSNLFAAVCPNAGLIGDYDGDLNKSPWTACNSTGPKKVPVVGIHGTTDRLVPIAGGKNPSSKAMWFSFDDTMTIWERRHGCSNAKIEEGTSSDGRKYTKRSFDNCFVTSYTIQQLAHEWWIDATPTCVSLFRQFGL